LYCHKYFFFFTACDDKSGKAEAYRERKNKNEGEAYLEKERKQIRGYYIPIEERSKKEEEKRRYKQLLQEKQVLYIIM
jgi:hypothetical protein